MVVYGRDHRLTVTHFSGIHDAARYGVVYAAATIEGVVPGVVAVRII